VLLGVDKVDALTAALDVDETVTLIDAEGDADTEALPLSEGRGDAE
jgi:hypothetical protein